MRRLSAARPSSRSPHDPPVRHGSGPRSGARRASPSPSAPYGPCGTSPCELFPGEAHALAGENGAGKSTLIKTLAGVHRPDAGQVLLDGEPAVFHGPADARDAGIAVIYQEPTLFPDLSIAENIFMGRQPRRALGRIDHKAMHARDRRPDARGSASTSTPTGPRAACPSPTSRSSRSPRRSPSTPAS